MKKFAIVCGSRTGSTYLCNLLKSTGRCGKAEEFYNPDLIDGYLKQTNLQPKCEAKIYNDRIIKKFSSPNSIFGVKVVGFYQWNLFRASDLQISHWIYLTRKNSLEQAISRYIAWSTNGWHRKKEIPPYSYKGIKWCLDEIKQENEFFEEYFLKTKHLRLNYEVDICEFPEQTVISILNYLNINLEELPEIRSKEREYKSITDEWKKLWVEDERKNVF